MASFMSLPFELREHIWQLCLPDRVFEVDTPWADVVHGSATGPRDRSGCCNTGYTSLMNVCIPVIAHVCREARTLTLRASERPDIRDLGYIPGAVACKPEDLEASPLLGSIDRTRCRPHLYYEAAYDGCHWWGGIPSRLNTLKYLADFAIHFGAQQASFMLGYLTRSSSSHVPWNPETADQADATISYPPPICADEDADDLDDDTEEALKLYGDSSALGRLRHWQVVMRVATVHIDLPEAIDTGLFGNLGEEPIQIVEYADERFEKYREVAQPYEDDLDPETRSTPDISKTRADQMTRRLIWALRYERYPTVLYDRLKPAVMFRLCTRRCHLPG